MIRAGWRVLAGTTVVAALLATGFTVAQESTTASMRGVFNALIQLLPLSVDEDRFDAPENREQILAALERLRDNAASVSEHGFGQNRSYERSSAALAQDSAGALEAFLEGNTRSSRYILRSVTETCFSCHSRLPAPERADIARAFADAVDVDQVPLEERVRVLVATRQFEASMQTAERLMVDLQLTPARIDLMGTFELYLKVALRVSRDVARPRVALERFLERDDLPMYLHLQAQEWIDALDELESLRDLDDLDDLDPEGTLATARSLLEDARSRNLYLQDRRGLVHATMASGLLYELISSRPDSRATLAMAYYLLGLAESVSSTGIWVPETEFFLETAIRMAPGTDVARDAYTYLEQFVIANYTGSAGTDVPDEVWSRLVELRELVQRR